MSFRANEAEEAGFQEMLKKTDTSRRIYSGEGILAS
jgi:hypothetical protein